MRVCVCGGGAIGHVLAALLGAHGDKHVSVLTRHPAPWRQDIEIHAGDRFRLVGKVQQVSHAPADCIPGADFVLLAVPAHVRAAVLGNVVRHLAPHAWLGCFGSSIGFDAEARRLVGRDTRFFGVQRTPWVARVIQPGRLVSVSGVRDTVLIAGAPVAPLSERALELGAALGVQLPVSGNYMDVNLSYDNPTLHPPRLYSLFGPNPCARPGQGFYRDWDDAASERLLAIDAELHRLRLTLGATAALSARRHFGTERAEAVTSSLRSSAILRAIGLPVRDEAAKNMPVLPDLQSRYFQEDILFGMAWQLRLAGDVGIAMPRAAELLHWAKELVRDRDSGGAIPC